MSKTLNISIRDPQDEFEVIERYLILLLGAINRPIPSSLHLQKELFVLSQSWASIQKFLKFLKHYKGPYSPEIQDLIESPMHYPDAFQVESGKICLTENGRQIYKALVQHHGNNPKFRRFLQALKLVRTLYDRLSRDELLLLIYLTYPEYTEKSEEFDRVMRRRKMLARSLLNKGLITEQRYKEIILGDVIRQ